MSALVALGLVIGGLEATDASAITPGEAAAHVGKSVTIEGFVEQVMCSPRACLMSFEAGWAGFVATVPSAAFDRFGDVKKFERHTVRLRGVVEDRQGKPRLDLTDPARIEIVDGASGAPGSRVVKAQRRSTVEAPDAPGPDPAAPLQKRTRVQVSGGLPSGTTSSSLSTIVRDLEEEAAVSGDGVGDRASQVAVEGLRDRVAMQAHTIQGLEEELAEMRDRLAELEDRPAPSLDDLDRLESAPAVDPWVVPAKRSLKQPQPRTGWSVKRLLREMGSPREVQEVSRDTAVWIYGATETVTVKRGRVLSASGF